MIIQHAINKHVTYQAYLPAHISITDNRKTIIAKCLNCKLTQIPESSLESPRKVRKLKSERSGKREVNLSSDCRNFFRDVSI